MLKVNISFKYRSEQLSFCLEYYFTYLHQLCIYINKLWRTRIYKLNFCFLCCSEKAYNILYFLPFGDWPFLDTSSSPSYDLVYFLQMSGTIIHGLIHASADSLYFSLATLICGQFEALSLVLRDIQKSDDYSELLACVHQHQQLLRYFF